ncbi:hypothetical protein U3516DRAFT_733264 [Neocallimastix sp. 'constans']
MSNNIEIGVGVVGGKNVGEGRKGAMYIRCKVYNCVIGRCKVYKYGVARCIKCMSKICKMYNYEVVRCKVYMEEGVVRCKVYKCVVVGCKVYECVVVGCKVLEINGTNSPFLFRNVNNNNS